MKKITLDTNCVINYFDKTDKVIIQLIRLALEHKIDLAITTRVVFDVEADKISERKNLTLKKLQQFPLIGTGARFGMTKLGSGDFFVGTDYVAKASALQKLLFPNLGQNNSRFRNKISDVDHLMGHIVNKRDFFVTTDKDFLTKREILKEKFGVKILTPQECLKELKSLETQNKNPRK